LEEATAYLRAAAAHRRETAAKCVERLYAARAAVNGLEREYDEILHDLEAFDLRDPPSRSKLRARIRRYLLDENLRPILVEVLAGLNKSEKALRKDAQKFLGVPAGRWIAPLAPGGRTRISTVDDLATHLATLERFLADLEQDYEGRPFQGPSGVGFDDLQLVEKALEPSLIPSEGDRRLSELRDHVRAMRATRSHSRLLKHAREVGELAASVEANLAR
jgi:hypothetical protein